MMESANERSSSFSYPFLQNISRRKRYAQNEDTYSTPLRRYLGTFDLTFLGIGSMFGAGLYILTGVVAARHAGPAVFVSYFIAGVASLLSSLCYAEFSCRIPRTGSAYLFTYLTIGEIWAFLIGWNMILEYVASAASVGRSFSGYIDALCDGQYSNFTITYLLNGKPWDIPNIASYPDILGAGFCLFVMIFVLLGVGTSSWMNNIFLGFNVIVVGIIIVLGAIYANINNWELKGGFAPFGVSGIISGAATCFYSYVGFDVIAISSEEALTPKKSIPTAMIMSIVIITLLYMVPSAILTLMIPYYDIIAASAFAEAFAYHGLVWAKWVVSVGAISSTFTCILTSLFCLPRSLYAMACDGLLFKFLAVVNERTQVPITAAIIFGIFVALLDVFFTLDELVAFLSIGVLCAYSIVAAALVVIRYRPEGYGIDHSTSEPGGVVQPGTKDLQPLISPAQSIYTTDDHVISEDSLDTRPVAGSLKEQFREWPIVRRLHDYPPGKVVMVALLVGFCLGVGAIALLLHGFTYVASGAWWAVILLIFLSFGSILLFLVIPMHYQNDPGEDFSVPWVPLIPILGLLINTTLMLKLGYITWIRFVVWVIVGLLIYGFYGYGHSKEAVSRQEEEESREMLPVGAYETSYGGTKDCAGKLFTPN